MYSHCWWYVKYDINMYVWILLAWYIYNTENRMTWIIDFRLCHTIRNYLSSSINLFICLLILITRKEPIYKFLLRHDNSTGNDIILTEWLIFSNICHQRCTGCFGKNMVFFFQKCSVFCTSLSPAELHLVVQKMTIYTPITMWTLKIHCSGRLPS